MADETKTMKDRIKDVTSKLDKKGKKIWITRCVGDNFVYCTYNEVLGSKLEKLTDQHVLIEYTGSTFRDVLDVKLDEEKPAPEMRESVVPQAGTDKDARIARAVALKAAVDYYAGVAKSLTEPSDQILGLADKFLAWLQKEEGS